MLFYLYRARCGQRGKQDKAASSIRIIQIKTTLLALKKALGMIMFALMKGTMKIDTVSVCNSDNTNI